MIYACMVHITLSTMNSDMINKLENRQFNLLSELDKLPEDLCISTITATCRWKAEINTQNVGRYIELTSDGIVRAKFGNGTDSERSIIPIPVKKRKSKVNATKNGKRNHRNSHKNKSETNFMHQVMLVVMVSEKKKINIKLFKNGSIQMTGVKNLYHFTTAINKISDALQKNMVTYSPLTGLFESKPFSETPEVLILDNIADLNIRMINSHFDVGFSIDREQLYELVRNKIICTYEPFVHACVNIKYHYDENNTVSVFVFESGNIIVTGGKTMDQIEKAYKYINKILYENYNMIVKNDINQILKRHDVQELLKHAETLYQANQAMCVYS